MKAPKVRVRDCCGSIPTITVSRSFSFCPQSGGDGAFDFPPHVERAVRLCRKDQVKNATRLDRLDDLLTVFRPGGYYVAQRNPAEDTLPFKARHDSERWGLVRVTQKNVVRHLLSEAKERGMFSVVTRSLLILHRGRTLDKLRAAALHRPRGRAARARREMSTGTVLPAGRAAVHL